MFGVANDCAIRVLSEYTLSDFIRNGPIGNTGEILAILWKREKNSMCFIENL